MITTVAGMKVNNIQGTAGVGAGPSSANSGDKNGLDGANSDYQSPPSDMSRLNRRMAGYRTMSMAHQQHFESSNEVRIAEQQKETMVLKQRHSESKTKKTTKKAESKKHDTANSASSLKRGNHDIASIDEEGPNKKRKPSTAITSTASATAIADFQIDQQIQNLRKNSPVTCAPSSSLPLDKPVPSDEIGLLNLGDIKEEESKLFADIKFDEDLDFPLEDSYMEKLKDDLKGTDAPPNFNSIMGELFDIGISTKEEPQQSSPRVSSPSTHPATPKNGEISSLLSDLMEKPEPSDPPISEPPASYPSRMPNQYNSFNKVRPALSRMGTNEMIPASQTLKQMAEQHQTKGNPSHVSPRPNSLEFHPSNISQIPQNSTPSSSFFNSTQKMAQSSLGDFEQRQQLMQQSISQGGPVNTPPTALPTGISSSRGGSYPLGMVQQQRPLGHFPLTQQMDSQGNHTESQATPRSANQIGKAQATSPLQSQMGQVCERPLSSGPPQSVLSPQTNSSQPSLIPGQPASQHMSQPSLTQNNSPGTQVNRMSPYPMAQAASFQPNGPGLSSNMGQQYTMNNIRGGFPNSQRGPSPVPANAQGMVNIHQQKMMQQQRMMGVMGKPQMVRGPPPEYRQAAILQQQQQQQVMAMNPGMNPSNFQHPAFRGTINAGSMNMNRMMSMNQQNMPANMGNMKANMMPSNMNMSSNMPHMDQGSMMANGMPGNMPMMNTQPGMIQRGRTPNGPMNMHPRMTMQNQMNVSEEWKQMMQGKMVPNIRYQQGNPDSQMVSMQRAPSQMMPISNPGMQTNTRLTNSIMPGMPGSINMAAQRMKQQPMGQNNQANMNMQMGMSNPALLNKNQGSIPNGAMMGSNMAGMPNATMQMPQNNMCMPPNAPNQPMPQNSTTNSRSPSNMVPSPTQNPQMNTSANPTHMNPSPLNRTNNPMMARNPTQVQTNPGIMLNTACPNGMGSLNEIKTEPNQDLRYHDGSFRQQLS